MTEAEWLACNDPEELRWFLRYNARLSERKLRLLACAFCRQNWHNLVDGRSKAAIQVVERFADGMATEEEVDEAASQASAVIPPQRKQLNLVQFERLSTAERTEWSAAQSACSVTAFGGGWDVYVHLEDVIRHSLEAAKCQMFGPSEQVLRGTLSEITRDVAGSPFRPVTIDPAWLTPTVTNLATAAYDERTLPSGELDLARLAILADALEEAGCANADILAHLRGPGPHVRG
jgi:hypothetical protein